MAERRFNEDEVAAIFARATEAAQTTRNQMTPAPSQGMTLAELEDIGREVGIAPELVRQAARTIDQRGSEVSRRFLGVPVGVGATVDLDRKLSEKDWEVLVSDLRQTFDATGLVRADGTLRQWRNGNLQASLEPTESGQRLRLRTFRSDASVFMMGGLGVLGLAGVMGISLAVGATGNLSVAKVTQIAILGAAIFSIGAVMVPAWARRRRQQMDEVIGRLLGRGGQSA